MAYFHFGRLSLSTPGWWAPETKPAEGKASSHPEVNFLAWAEQEGIDAFVPWTAVEHPDFPGKKVEVGGIKPFLLYNPPFEKVADIATTHTDFILSLAAKAPKLEFHDVKTEKLSNGLTRVTATLYNNSPIPTHTEMGERSRWLRKVRVDINKKADDLVAGEKIKLINSVGAYEKVTMSWVIQGSGSVEVKAGAAHTGFAKFNVNL
ncbi:hypothetical protein [Nitritalea halalkaliphila]|uniref:hypothetical protein n=1 Tax=Nitritalea halalkaliphila TaxID=590849 RepID=UPI0002F96462|nr:hypothetical protein [Nitritalea halalkaliphila]